MNECRVPSNGTLHDSQLGAYKNWSSKNKHLSQKSYFFKFGPYVCNSFHNILSTYHQATLDWYWISKYQFLCLFTSPYYISLAIWITGAILYFSIRLNRIAYNSNCTYIDT